MRLVAIDADVLGRERTGDETYAQLGQVLTELDDEIREEILEHVPSQVLAKALGEMESDDAADVVELTSMAARPGRRGNRRMRAAIPLLEPHTDSPMETRLRLLIVRAGLPRPVAGHDVVVDGEWLARPDLSYPGLRIAIEYDGDHHRVSRAQWRRDIGRRRLLEDAGWLLIVLTADDVLRHPELTVDRVRRAIAARTPR